MQQNLPRFCRFSIALVGVVAVSNSFAVEQNGVPERKEATVLVMTSPHPTGGASLSVSTSLGRGSHAVATFETPDLGALPKNTHHTFRFDGRSYEYLAREGTTGKFEAIIAHGGTHAVFTGVTGFVGEPGEREGVFLRLSGEPSEPTSVDLATQREGTRVCGEDDLAATETRTLKGGRFVRSKPVSLSEGRIANAVDTKIGPLFVTSNVTLFAPTSASRRELTRSIADGAKLDSREFVTFQAPKLTVERVRLAFVAARSDRTLYLVSRKTVYRLTVPKGSSELVAALPAAEASTCWSIVADEPTELRGIDAHSPIFDKAQTPGDLAALVARGDADAPSALETLRILGPEGGAALDARMVDIPERLLPNVEGALSGLPCDALVSPMSKLGARAKVPLATRARHHLERCARTALGNMVNLLSEPSPHGLLVGDALVSSSPQAVCAAMLKWAGKGDPQLRRGARALLSRVAARCDADAAKAALFRSTGDAQTDLLGGLRSRERDLSEPLLDRALVALSGDFDSRWMAIRALSALAIDHHEAAIALEGVLEIEKDAHLLALACGGLVQGRGSQSALALAATNPHPRVREAAIFALERIDGKLAGGAAADAWAFVREAAAAKIAEPKLLEALLRDPVADVRIAAARAIASGKQMSLAPHIATRLRDRNERIHVRRELAVALGAMCAKSSIEALADVATTAAHGDDADRDLGPDVLRALARIDDARALTLAKQWPPRAAKVLAAEIRYAQRVGTCK